MRSIYRAHAAAANQRFDPIRADVNGRVLATSGHIRETDPREAFRVVGNSMALTVTFNERRHV